MAVGVQNSNPNGRWYSKLMPLDLFSLACYLTTSSSRPVDWGLLSFEFPDRHRSQLPLRAAVFTRIPVGCFVAVVGVDPRRGLLENQPEFEDRNATQRERR